jgi:hypothetical protein
MKRIFVALVIAPPALPLAANAGGPGLVEKN